jgi:cell division protease FtsH
MDIMHSMKDALMKYETIDAGQIDDLMDRKSEIRDPAGWVEQDLNAQEKVKSTEPKNDTTPDDPQNEEQQDKSDSDDQSGRTE